MVRYTKCHDIEIRDNLGGLEIVAMTMHPGMMVDALQRWGNSCSRGLFELPPVDEVDVPDFLDGI